MTVHQSVTGGGVLELRLDDRARRNALSAETIAELAGHLERLGGDDDLRVGILTGTGDVFCSGGDTSRMGAQRPGPWARRDLLDAGVGRLARLFVRLDKPVIAAVNGVAMGGGFEIALACDLIIASETASFALPEPRVGLAALAGGLHRLPRQIGAKRAMGMILTGRRVGAEEGRELGFVNEVTPPDELMARAKHWAGMVLDCSPMSIRASKQAVYGGLDIVGLKEAVETRFPAVIDMVKSEDFVEGPRAFAEKRKPDWKGR